MFAAKERLARLQPRSKLGCTTGGVSGPGVRGTASGLLNLPTSLAETVVPATPGRMELSYPHGSVGIGNTRQMLDAAHGARDSSVAPVQWVHVA